jgi:hypothetical protein
LSDDSAIQAIIAEELNVVGQRLTDQLVTEGRPRDVTEIAVVAWLALVCAACVKWVQAQNISRADLTKLCLHAFDCALDIPTPTSRSRARAWREHGPAVSSLNRVEHSELSERPPRR